jgi:hypothetical protein
MKLKLVSTIAIAALASGVAFSNASATVATVATFDDISAPQQFSQFTDAGLNFTSNGASSYMYVWDGSAPNSNGTNNNIFASYFYSGGYETITRTGGGAFNLRSIDFAISFYDSNPTDTITINGTPLTITQTLTTYALNMNGVTSVNISGVASNSGYWLADNVTYTAAPETSTWAMMLAGFGALGFAGYRRRRAVAA